MYRFIILAIFLTSQISLALTLAEKERIFNDRANASKKIFGLIGGTSDTPIWTGVYVASQAYRYEVTKDPEARQQLEESLWGLVKLHNVTKIPGLISKMITPATKDAKGKLPAEYFPSANSEFKDYAWKGGISFDQYVGYIYGLTEGFFAVEDLELKNAIRTVMSNIGDHFINNKERIIGPMTNLDFDPDSDAIVMKPSPGLVPSLFLKGGRAMYALLLMKSVSVVTDLKRFKNYYNYLIKERNYDLLIRHNTQGNTEQIVKSNLFFLNLFTKVYVGTAVKPTVDSLRSPVAQNLGHISLSQLAVLEKDPRIFDNYAVGFNKAHTPVARHSNTFWNFLYSRATFNDPAGIKEGLRSLRVFPMDDYGKRTNSTDPKIAKYKGLDANFFKGSQWQWFAKNPIPFEKRPMHSFAWQQNAHLLDGQFGAEDAPGVAYLVAYWLGRKQGYISAAD